MAGVSRRSQAAKFIFPGEHPLNGAKALFKDRRIEAALATVLRRFASTRVLGNVGNHAAIENRLAVGPSVVDAVQTDDCALQVHADSARYLAEPGQRVAQQGRFVTVAGSGDERRDDVSEFDLYTCLLAMDASHIAAQV
jgi:hypothetical protein